ncbi:anti-sigma-D factor RsdA [Umezawaea sp. Da 62-37]|uniref:anti-sigma-D factor RsdA n=1 Tax=Umezawaea sp. Da 62-37 TaxID=3075927 RepID=UPI0028F72502|nr:anti-sigma-D factor RsdA [Umezawaea sp. Da 62-37]WNV90826.1 anti-sigma-D factor RsdA [Umezawaea sp. Da 62-37]
MADQHEKDNGEVVRGQRRRAQLPSDEQVDLGGDSSPSDLSGIQADDALLDALGGKDPDRVGELVQDDLNALLLAWRHDVDSQAIGALVDTDTAIATIVAARPAPRSRHRFLIPLASAAAVLAIAFTGVSLVARDAQPGDPLWTLTRVLYADHARSVEAAVAVKGDLDAARAALREGKVNEAKDALDKAGVALPKVSSDDGHGGLLQTHEQLLVELTSTTTNPASTSDSSTTKTKEPKPTKSSSTSPTTDSSDTTTPETSSSTTTTEPVSSSSQPSIPPPPPPEETTDATTSGFTPRSESDPVPTP